MLQFIGAGAAMRNRQVVPALMFHSVGLENYPWAWSYISESVSSFEAKIRLLSKKGFNGVFWGELYDYMAGRRTLPENPILLTFDDGYLDNWVHVYPILKKYGMKGTVFVSPDFVDPLETARPNLDDVAAGRCDRAELTLAGFLSWTEMREMEKSGLIDIQSHAMSHTWYFSGPEIVEFHRPHEITPYPWLFWNARQDRKPYYLNEDQQEYVPWGHPIFEHEKSLVARCWVPEKNAIKMVTDWVSKNGGRDLFRQQDWRGVLQREVAKVLDRGVFPGTYESDEERQRRITVELQRSKSLIEAKLGKSCDFVCWPGGANDDNVLEIARAVGYKSWTLDSRSRLGKRNVPGSDPSDIKRIGTGNSIGVRGRICGTGGPRYFLWRIFQHQGSSLYSAVVRVYKGVALSKSIFQGHKATTS